MSLRIGLMMFVTDQSMSVADLAREAERGTDGPEARDEQFEQSHSCATIDARWTPPSFETVPV